MDGSKIRRSVADAAALLSAMAGPDPRDVATGPSAGHLQRDYTKFLDPAGLRGARIGVARAKFFGYHDATDRAAESALDVLRREGAMVIDPANIPSVVDPEATDPISCKACGLRGPRGTSSAR